MTIDAVEKRKPTFVGIQCGSWFCVAFCYFEDGSLDVFSGSYLLVEQHLKTLEHKSFCHFYYYRNNKVQKGTFHTIVDPKTKRFLDAKVYITRAKRGGIMVVRRDDDNIYTNIYLRRAPKKWIPAFSGDFTGHHTFNYTDPEYRRLRGLPDDCS